MTYMFQSVNFSVHFSVHCNVSFRGEDVTRLLGWCSYFYVIRGFETLTRKLSWLIKLIIAMNFPNFLEKCYLIGSHVGRNIVVTAKLYMGLH